MKRSSTIKLNLVAAAAAIVIGCSKEQPAAKPQPTVTPNPEHVKVCVDKVGTVVDPTLCNSHVAAGPGGTTHVHNNNDAFLWYWLLFRGGQPAPVYGYNVHSYHSGRYENPALAERGGFAFARPIVTGGGGARLMGGSGAAAAPKAGTHWGGFGGSARSFGGSIGG